MMVRLCVTVFLMFVITADLLADNNGDLGNEADKDTNSTKLFSSSDPIISAIDSLMIVKFFETSSFTTDIDTLNIHSYSPDYIPAFPDLTYECRLSELNVKTPIELDFNNEVKKYIDVYTISRRDQLSRMLGLTELYYPIFEEELDRLGLPMELKHLAVVESALNPLARSKSGAVGLWQFLYNTGKMFDLNTNSYIDERRDPYKSTKAACEYLQYLHRIFNDWQLALAAYNGGPGTVRNAIKRSGGKTGFWEIRPYLPLQTQNYVPAFIAVNYAMNYSVDHNIYPVAPSIFYNEIDTVHITHSLYFDKLAAILDIPVETLKLLNPSYKTNFVPYGGKPVVFVLPVDKVAGFIDHVGEIYGYEKPRVTKPVSNDATGDKTNKVRIIHTVKKGEYFHGIAIRYRCTIGDIREWNNMQTDYLHMGKELEIWVDQSFAKEIQSARKEELEEKLSGSFIYYTVQNGDTLWKIANKFNCKDIAEIKLLNNLNNENSLSPGVRLKICATAN